MIIGFVIGLFRMGADTLVTTGTVFQENSFLWIVTTIPFQYFSVLITIISAVVMVAVSYATAAPDYGRITGLTFATATSEDRAKTRASWGRKEVLASLVIMACITFAYLYFRG
jgi:SSS family solute:Na+ symporter